MKINFFAISFLLMLITSCKTFNLVQASQTQTKQQVVLGSIGSEKEFILQKGFNNTAIPKYKPIKLAVDVKSFTKPSYNAFSKAKTFQSANVTVNYIDSIPNKPKYLQLQIADKVALIKALNNEENTSEKAYLSHNTYAQVLTSLSIALNQKDLDSIIDADAVFLIEHGLKTYTLQLYKNKVKTQIISFNEGVVFEYQVSNCCWQENNKHQMDIVDLVSKYTNCPKNTSRSSKKPEKKLTHYYKL